MPQIAQQDYIKAVATPGRNIDRDCNVLSILAKALEAGTLFDVIIVSDDSGDICEANVLGRDGNVVYYFDTLNEEITHAIVLYTPAQYAALSAIQLEVDRIDEIISGIPALENNSGFLMGKDSSYLICNPDGYKYAVVTDENDKIATISVSDRLAEGGYIVLDEETAQDLIGLPIN